MPTYEYKCPLCHQAYTEVRGIMEEQKLIKCDNCKVDLIRQFGTPTVTFNGSGFYATDKKKRD